MSFLKKLFEPSYRNIWKQLEQEIGAKYQEGGFLKNDKVTIHEKEWTITLDVYTVRSKNHTSYYTRMRAPFVNPDKFRFTIRRQNLLDSLGKSIFGMQDITIGDPAFDENFIVKSNNESMVRSLFSNTAMRELFMQYPALSITVKDDEGWFGGSFPDGVDELHFLQYGIIQDIDTLKNMFMLFAETLHQLCYIGAAYETNPQVEL